MKTHNDFHKQGLYAVKTPSGEIVLESCATTGYSARSEFVRYANKPWSVSEAQGYTIVEFTPVAIVTKNEALAVLKVPSTARDWALYQGDDSDEAAKEIGEILRSKLTAAQTSRDLSILNAIRIRDEMYVEMSRYRKSGARDTEPESILVDVITRAFGMAPGEVSRF